MKQVLFLIAALWGASLSAQTTKVPKYAVNAVVAKAANTDGDNEWLLFDTVLVKCRLRCINAPEGRYNGICTKEQPGFKESRAALRSMLPPGTKVKADTSAGRDKKYGRLQVRLWYQAASVDSIHLIVKNNGIGREDSAGIVDTVGVPATIAVQEKTKWRDVSLEMLKSGLAWYVSDAKCPRASLDKYRAAWKKAVTSGTGLWDAEVYQTPIGPWLWHKMYQPTIGGFVFKTVHPFKAKKAKKQS